jgi:hemoglobin/transferrin/lactoferrin receptor protein
MDQPMPCPDPSRERAAAGALRFPAAVAAVLVLLASPAPAALAQDSDPAPATAASTPGEEAAGAQDPESLPSVFATTTVTATLHEVDSFEIPMSVSVIHEVESRPANNAAELLVTEPGVEINGVGANQTRPIIRGQRGLRVLFLQNGLSINNPRRQTDFGEITGVVDLESIESVEVVRGPASVLYGSGAIGGVLNVVSKAPPAGTGRDLRGSFSGRLSTADEQEKLTGGLHGYAGRLGYSLLATTRDAEDYEAASGSFGGLRLDREARVFDTGIEDDTLSGDLRYRASDRQSWALSGHRYRADQFGFGFVDPALLDPEFDGTQTRILYPYQDFDRYTLGWSGAGYQKGPFNTFDVRLYRQSNERELAFDAFINIGPIFPSAPASDIEIDTLNFTDLDTTGLRAEASRGLGDRHLLTFGVDLVEDDLVNTDGSLQVTNFRFPFPPSVIGVIPGFTCVDFVPPFECSFETVNDVANAPNAENRSYGLFLQDEVFATDRFKAIAGARYQQVETVAKPTPGLDITGLDFDDDAVVGSLSLLYEVLDGFELVGSVGTAFRAPSLVERLFNGLTPEGLGYQVLNADLESETSEYWDLGFKSRSRRAFLEGSYFQNRIDDGIIQDFLSPAEIALLPADVRQVIETSGVSFVVQQRNVDRVEIEGVELVGGFRFANGWSLGGNYTHLDSRRVDSDNPPTGDVAADSYNGWVRYERPRWSVEYRARHNGSERVVLEEGDPVPVTGEFLPSFTVHSLNGLVELFDTAATRHRLGVAIYNLTDELYAEFSNIGSFRPEPKRSVIVTYRLEVD